MATETNEPNKATSEPRVAQDERDERDRLIHDLEVHQAELEAQNQQLREAHHQLEESRARYSDLYDFAPVAYCTFDPAGRVLEINLAGAAMLGLQRSRVIGKPFAVFVLESDRAAFRMHLQRRLSVPQGPAVVELTLESSAKHPIVVQMVSAVARNHGGAIVSCRSTFTDISEQKRAEEALRLAVQMREEFLAIVSHDLRNPLNSVLLGSEMLQGTSDAASRGKLELIHNAATRMSRMLSDLLDLSSMDAGHLSVERKPESVDALLAATAVAASPSAVARAIQLDVLLEEPELVAYCDRDRILQVLMNLVGNAIKSSRAATAMFASRRGEGATRSSSPCAIPAMGSRSRNSITSSMLTGRRRRPQSRALGSVCRSQGGLSRSTEVGSGPRALSMAEPASSSHCRRRPAWSGRRTRLRDVNVGSRDHSRAFIRS
jgi:PAS domain S-box-containing protein